MYICYFIIYCILSYVNRKDKILFFLLLIQTVSIFSLLIVDPFIEAKSLLSFLNYSFVFITSLMIIFAWKGYENKDFDIGVSLKRLNLVADVICFISIFIMIVFIIVSIVLYTTISPEDINKFKYVEGNAMDFYYNSLPIDARLLFLSDSMYMLSYFLIPLHFIYMVLQDKKRCFKCGLFSLNIVLHGMTFFSRWTVTIYVLLYCFTFLLFRKKISPAWTRSIKKTMTIVFALLLSGFVSISVSRFGENDSYSDTYIDKSSLVRTPMLHSVFDYMGQYNKHAVDVLDDYDGETFNGGYSFGVIKNILWVFGLTGRNDVSEKIEKLWPNNWWTFNGFTAYTVYDMGYLMTFIICLSYFLYFRTQKKALSVNQVLFISLISQIPLCSIFYSQLGDVLFLMIPYSIIALFIKK